MKNNSIKINIAFLISIILSVFEILAGVYFAFLAIDSFSSDFIDQFAGEYGTFLMIILFPLVIIMLIPIIILGIVCGIIPTSFGFITGLLTLLARFKYVDHDANILDGFLGRIIGAYALHFLIISIEVMILITPHIN